MVKYYYCPHCSDHVGTFNGPISNEALQEEFGCFRCRTIVRGYQLLETPISIAMITALLSDRDRYERFAAQEPMLPESETGRVKAYLIACILGEA